MIGKKLVFGLLIAAMMIGCSTEDPCEVPTSFEGIDMARLEADKQKIAQYLQDNNIDAEEHPTGFSYVINKPGNGGRPNICNFVVVGYRGELLDGTFFDGTTPDDAIRFQLSQLIPGWQAGIPLITAGGNITLYIPSPLGYGSRPVGNIPANSVLVFEIELFAVQ